MKRWISQDIYITIINYIFSGGREPRKQRTFKQSQSTSKLLLGAESPPKVTGARKHSLSATGNLCF